MDGKRIIGVPTDVGDPAAVKNLFAKTMAAFGRVDVLLNAAGRPLEFHCTAPIKPNRAQEILYGPTLESFLYGEQIGQTLIGQSNFKNVPGYAEKKRTPILLQDHGSAVWFRDIKIREVKP